MNTAVDAIMATFSVCEQEAGRIVELLNLYEASGFAPPNMAGEITTRVPERVQAVIWEAMLYWHFRNLGVQFRNYIVKKSGQNAPDLCIDCNGRRLWIEAVVATPKGLPGEWLAPVLPGEFSAFSFPHEEILLRYTSALADKKRQLDKRCAKGIVSVDDAYVIAVNGCMLSRVSWGESHGISGWPFIVEAAFPIGPITIPFNLQKIVLVRRRIAFATRSPNRTNPAFRWTASSTTIGTV